MKRIQSSVILILFIFILTSCTSENSRESNIYADQLFDFGWKFRLDDDSTYSELALDDAEWRNLDLPHDWSIEGAPQQVNPMAGAGGYFPDGVGWYRKSFDVPADWQDKSVSVYFEGVYMLAEVFINGHSLGTHPYGYTSFSHDLSKYLIPGTKNTLAVRVDNSDQINCRWYSGSGIYRHVWLAVKNPIHIAKWGVSITTPEVEDTHAKVLIKTKVINESEEGGILHLKAKLVDGNNYRSSNNKQLILPADQTEFTTAFDIDFPQLWSPESPSLYEVELTLSNANDEVLDQMTVPFGIRSLEFSVSEGFKLNGKKVLLNGGCIHHDNGALGAKAYDRAEERRVELMKGAGFNALRTSHNPPSEAFLRACDRLGMLVIDESFDGWREQKTPGDYAKYIDEWWKSDLEAMVLRDMNHPSIIMWSSGNEIIERTNPEAIKTANMLNAYIRALDPTRPVTSAMTTWGQGWARFDSLFATHDIGGYNYQMHEAEKDHERVPSRIIVQTESYPREAFKNWDMVNKHPYIIGDFVWTAMDYLGESGIGRYFYPDEPVGEHWETDLFPWHGAYCGDVDLMGWRKPISHYRSMLWNDNEKLYMAVKEPNPTEGAIRETMWSVWPTWESWTWPGYEGKTLEVEVYSKYQSVRLYLNDSLMGEKPVGYEQEFKAVFAVPYAHGTLKTEGLTDGRVMETRTLQTAGDPAKIQMSADRTSIQSNGQDLSFVSIEILDENGVLQPNATSLLSFDVEGPADLIAVDNANLKDDGVYTADFRKAWNGKAMLVVKSRKEKGQVMIKAKSNGLTTGQISINVD